MKGAERPPFTLIPGGKPSRGERSGGARTESLQEQAAAFLNRFHSFREAHPFVISLTPAGSMYYHLAGMESTLQQAGDEEGFTLTNRVGEAFIAKTFDLLDVQIQYPEALDYAKMGWLEKNREPAQRRLPLTGVESMILAALLTEVNVPYQANPAGDSIPYQRYILQMREFAFQHGILAQSDPDAQEGNITIQETPPPNVTKIIDWTRRHPTRRKQ